MIRYPTVFAALVAAAVTAASSATAASFAVTMLNAVTSRQGYTVSRGIAYGDLPRQKLDLYVPADLAADAPIVVFFYGGAWNRGERGDYLFVGQSLATAGFIVAVPDYRLYPEVVFPDFITDGAEAVASVREKMRRPDGTRRQIFLAGHSAGAHIAALLNLDERYLAGAGVPRKAIGGTIGLSGPYDFLPLKEEIYRKTFPEPVRAASQPIAFVDGREAPMLLIAGAADDVVDPRNTTSLAAAIEARHGAARVKIYPRVGHAGTVAALATATLWPKPDIRATIIEFIRERLGQARG